MEYLDIINEDGSLTGRIKERSAVHRDGDLHHTSHVWIARKNDRGGMDILLQKRSDNKDCFPGCYDISSAGHIPAGSDFLESAVRELKEELSLEVKKEELLYKGTRRIRWEQEFHGELFRDNQISNIYLLWRDLEPEKLVIQKEEISDVRWMDFEECVNGVKNNTFPNCIIMEELEMIKTSHCW